MQDTRLHFISYVFSMELAKERTILRKKIDSWYVCYTKWALIEKTCMKNWDSVFGMLLSLDLTGLSSLELPWYVFLSCLFPSTFYFEKFQTSHILHLDSVIVDICHIGFLFLLVYAYVYIYVYVCVCVCVYTYIHRIYLYK